MLMHTEHPLLKEYLTCVCDEWRVEFDGYGAVCKIIYTHIERILYYIVSKNALICNSESVICKYHSPAYACTSLFLL